jgi:hypothetical protein
MVRKTRERSSVGELPHVLDERVGVGEELLGVREVDGARGGAELAAGVGDGAHGGLAGDVAVARNDAAILEERAGVGIQRGVGEPGEGPAVAHEARLRLPDFKCSHTMTIDELHRPPRA